jgi:quercetin dioxygenase-like cupin family protein
MTQPRVVEPEIVIDNDLARVVRWTLAPGTAIGPHRHPLPYIVVPVVGGTITFVDDAGARPVELVAAQPVFRPAGIEHDVQNRSDGTAVFVEVEIREPGSAGDLVG